MNRKVKNYESNANFVTVKLHVIKIWLGRAISCKKTTLWRRQACLPQQASSFILNNLRRVNAVASLNALQLTLKSTDDSANLK